MVCQDLPESGTAKANRKQRFNCMSANKACNHAEKIKAENDGNAILYTVKDISNSRDSTESQIYWHRGDSDSSYYYDNTGHLDKNRRYTHDTLTNATDTAFLSYLHSNKSFW